MDSPTRAPHRLLVDRFSPSSFDPTHHLAESDLATLLDAARWAPSAGNSQPWGFFVGRRGDRNHARITPHLARSSRAWAPDASALIVAVAHEWVDDGVAYSEFADYDLGQAVAHLTIQAHADGLACHQFRAFDLDALTAELMPAYGWTIRTIVAVGRAADAAALSRARRSVTDLLTAPWAGAVT